jgi:acetyl esterase/lipase
LPSYLGMEPGGEAVSAYAAPGRQQNLAGLPPAFIGASDIELFFDEDRAYADRLRQQGVAVVFETIHGAPHGFEELARDSDIAKAYLARALDWLRHRISARMPSGA